MHQKPVKGSKSISNMIKGWNGAIKSESGKNESITFEKERKLSLHIKGSEYINNIWNGDNASTTFDVKRRKQDVFLKLVLILGLWVRNNEKQNGYRQTCLPNTCKTYSMSKHQMMQILDVHDIKHNKNTLIVLQSYSFSKLSIIMTNKETTWNRWMTKWNMKVGHRLIQNDWWNKYLRYTEGKQMDNQNHIVFRFSTGCLVTHKYTKCSS